MSDPTILVVEDNPITRKMLRVTLASEGYRVLEAGDGEAALGLAALEAIDLILLDILLPDMSGFDVVVRLRALPALTAAPILAISGFLSHREQSRCNQVGFTDYLFKPVEPSHLLLTVSAYLPPRTCPEGPRGGGKLVLVVDDDPVQLKLLRVQVEQLGFRVATAADGAAALDQARALRPDAVISDVLMPHTDGFRLCLAIRQEPELARVPVVLTSAVYTEEADQTLAIAIGADAFVLRSPDNREVTEALLACLSGAAGAQAPPMEVELPLEEYTHRVIRQLEHQVGLSAELTRRLALLEAELGILGRLLETLRNTPVPELVVGELLYRCLDAAGISRGAAYLVGPDGRLSLRAQLGYPADLAAELPDYFGQSELLRQVLRTGEPLEVRSLGAPDRAASELLARSGAQSVLLTPLLLGEQPLGVLEMASANRDLDADWVPFARAVAGQVVQALELARAVSRLRQSEERYRELVEGLDAIVWEAEPVSGRFTYVSPQAERMLGYPRARWFEPGFFTRLLHPDNREAVLGQARAALPQAEKLSLEFRVVTADERVVWLQSSTRVERDASGHVRQLCGVMVDVTERKKLEEQDTKLRVAREIHARLFPAAAPALPGLDLAGISRPAETMGGDYFDYLSMADGCLGIVVGDASGHGFGPALLMAETRAYLRGLVQSCGDVGEVLTRLNEPLARGNVRMHFVTMFLAQLDLRTRTLTYASAGHPSACILGPEGGVKAVLPSTDLPLGLEEDTTYVTVGPLALEPGDLAVVFTDGVLETRSPDGTDFGEHRALDIVRAYRGGSAREIVENLYAAARAFAQNLPQDDDVTAVILKVGERPA